MKKLVALKLVCERAPWGEVYIGVDGAIYSAPPASLCHVLAAGGVALLQLAPAGTANGVAPLQPAPLSTRDSHINSMSEVAGDVTGWRVFKIRHPAQWRMVNPRHVFSPLK